jgi:hypothetical protein
MERQVVGLGYWTAHIKVEMLKEEGLLLCSNHFQLKVRGDLTPYFVLLDPMLKQVKQ